MKPKNSKLGPGRPSLRRLWLGDSQNFTLPACSSGTLVAGGSLALEEAEQKRGRCLLGVLRGFPSWVGDDLEDMSARFHVMADVRSQERRVRTCCLPAKKGNQ